MTSWSHAAQAEHAPDLRSPRLASKRARWREAVLYLARALGLFALSAWIYRHRQVILCYHAFSYEDEHVFRPQLYMRPQRFAQRLDCLRRIGCRVITLTQAIERLQSQASDLREVAITIDDGFTSVHDFALPELRARDLPATLYLTTYYVERPGPVFRLALQYLLWKSGRSEADLGLQQFGVDVVDPVPLQRPGAERAIEAIIDKAERDLDDASQLALLRHVGATLGISAEGGLHERRFRLVTPDMARELLAHGVDLQLHTHRHRFPSDPNLLRREIDDNRRVLTALGRPAATHLCYPSGEYRNDAFAKLTACGVQSASTCQAGLNSTRTHPMMLSRFLDADDISEVEFEAEVRGFKQLLRDLASFTGR